MAGDGDRGYDGITIGVVGLGYVGLPTALAFHKAGFKVIGVDKSQRVVDSLLKGVSHLLDESSDEFIPHDLDNWSVTNDFGICVPNSDVILITVPTPVDEKNEPDLGYVESAARNVLENIDWDKKTTIVLESTVFPGVTRRVFGEISKELGVPIGENVSIAYCPERVDPGVSSKSVSGVAQIVGCDDPVTGEWLAGLFGKITDEGSTYVGKMEVAEASKLIENVQRDIDIAFVNELSVTLPRMGIDVEEVLAAAATKWNFHRHTPGIGVGGHCIPIDPYYYISISENVGFQSILSKAAREINESMPKISVGQIKSIFQDGLSGKKVLILGYSYKPELGDTRETPVKYLSELLSSSECEVHIYDPLVKENLPEFVTHVTDLRKLEKVDLVILATGHSEFINLDWVRMKETCPTAKVFDGRRCLNQEELEGHGWKYFGIGLPIVEQ